MWFARSEIQLQSTLSGVWQLSFSKLLAFIVSSRCFLTTSSTCWRKNSRVSSHFRTFLALASEQLSAFSLKAQGSCDFLYVEWRRMSRSACVSGVYAFWGAFIKLRKVTAFICPSVCPSAWNNSAPTRWIFMKFDIRGIFSEVCGNI